MGKIGMEEGEAIVSPMLTRTVEKAQRRVEEQNFSSRKHVLEYDDVMSQQRQVVYGKRREALFGRYKADFIQPTLHSIIFDVAQNLSPEAQDTEVWNFDNIKKEIKQQVHFEPELSDLDPEVCSADAIAETATEQVIKYYKEKVSNIPEEMVPKLENYIYLQILDQVWKEHLLSMDSLKDSVSLRGYGQRDPLQEYKKEAFQLFASMMERVEYDTSVALINMPEPRLNPNAEGDQEYMTDEDGEQPNPFLTQEPKEPVKEDKLIYRGSQIAKDLENEPQNKPSTPIRRENQKVGRNDTCPCGSGKKYKKCCGRSSASV